MFAQNSDTAQTKLKFPISDRNTSFVTTKSVATIDLKDPSVIIKTIEYDPKTNILCTKKLAMIITKHQRI